MSFQLSPALEERIQCNILKPHNRNVVGYLYFRWPGGLPTHRYRDWVRRIGTEVTWYSQQKDASSNYRAAIKQGLRGRAIPQSYAINLGLTYAAYQKMGRIDQAPGDRFLKQGMIGKDFFPPYNQDAQGRDPLTKFFGLEVDHHAIIAVAHDDKPQVLRKLTALVSKSDFLLPGGEVFKMVIQPNRNAPSPPAVKGPASGPFGFTDGISNPRNLKEAVEFAFGSSDLTILEGKEDLGTYMALQKITCHVGAFKLTALKLRDAINDRKGMKISASQAQALLMGRHRAGAPVNRYFKTPRSLLNLEELNNFDYRDAQSGKFDDQGSQCPFHAHTRRVNDRKHPSLLKPIIRRGITYNHRDGGPLRQALLFISFQASIERQLLPIYQCMFEKKPKDAVTYTPPPPLLLPGHPKLKYFAKFGDANSGIIELDRAGIQLVNFLTGAFYYLPSKLFIENP